jgi:hypothetical protein
MVMKHYSQIQQVTLTQLMVIKHYAQIQQEAVT